MANPRGFCAGVERAIEVVERALALFGAPIYVRHEVVHNVYVVTKLRKQGAIFTDELESIPEGSICIFSAHGVSPAVRAQAAQRKLRVFDATCPLVTKVHMEVARFARQGKECILIGHAGHPEVEGTMGQYDSPEGGIYLVEVVSDVKKLQIKNPNNLAYVTQTTLSVDDTKLIVEALKVRFPEIKMPTKMDICYATQNRQEAVKQLASQVNVLLVVGSKTSSNSNRLRELAAREGVYAFLIDGPDDLEREWFRPTDVIGVTAGASAPEVLVQNVVQRLQTWGAETVEEAAGEKENIVFILPKKLRSEKKSLGVEGDVCGEK